MLDESSLHWVHLLWRSESFNRGDLNLLLHRSEEQTTVGAPTIDMDGACTALAMITAFLGASQMQGFPQGI